MHKWGLAPDRPKAKQFPMACDRNRTGAGDFVGGAAGGFVEGRGGAQRGVQMSTLGPHHATQLAQTQPAS
jgi:hypothetical protein